MLVEESWTTDDEDRKKEILERAETHARAAIDGHSDDAEPVNPDETLGGIN